MNFTFLHPEFFYWMMPPVALLFYFWQTQKAVDIHWLSETALKRLHAPTMTMGLKARNTLFLSASLFLIAAMAQPVMVNDTSLVSSKANVVLALEMGKEPAIFEKTQAIAVETIRLLEESNIGIVAYDEAVFRISPYTRQKAILSALVENIGFTQEGVRQERARMIETLNLSGALRKADALLILSAESHPEIFPESSCLIAVIGDARQILPVVQRLEQKMQVHRNRAHIPLFFYPLGMGMLLILIALSSMSKRQSVSLAAAGLLSIANAVPSEAGLLDFQLLDEAKVRYERGEYTKSERLYAQYQRMHDSAEVRYNRANALFKAGDYEKALYWYTQVHTIDPILRNKTAYNLGLTLQKLKAVTTEKHIPKKKSPSHEMPTEEKKGTIHPSSSGKTRLFTIP